MSSIIQVTPEQMETTAGRIETLAGEYKAQYENFYKEVEAMGSTNKGEAHTTFVNQVEGFRDDLVKMFNLMNEYADFLKKSAKSYREAQALAAEQARKLTN